MGRDGAEGLLALHNRNWYTIAQDQDSSIVYGMPKAAAELGAARDILPANKIGQAISNYLLVKQSRK
jgi:two-component system response regulator WspF